MTALSHLDPNFGSVAALEAMNEPIMDASKTPGLGECMFHIDKQFIHFIAIIVQKNFVQTVRAVEISLGIPVPGINLPPSPRLGAARDIASAFTIVSTLSSIFNPEVLQVLIDAIPVFEQVAEQLDLNTAFAQGGLRRRLARRGVLVTKYVTSFTGRGFF